ncbi:MAG: hypothetical protein AB7V50_10515, partial [Vampirovibrionia bacterium]
MNDLIYKIILIGNDLTAYKSELELRNHNVFEYTDGIKVLNAIDKETLETTDVIILSLNTTNVSGWELLRKIKATSSIKDIPLLLVSEFD